MKIGVLALQGAFREQCAAFDALGVESVELRSVDQLAGLDAVVLPGGESTAITKLLDGAGLWEPLADLLRDGMPAFGTCAGLILMAADVVDGLGVQRSFGVLDCSVRRNAYGTQAASFEADLMITDLGGGPFPGVFIRAPVVEATGPDVKVLATYGGSPVLCHQGSVMAATFHPELSGDLRIHQRFLQEVAT